MREEGTSTMLAGYEGPSVVTLAAQWWTLIVRGAAAVLFGALTLLAPGISLLSIVLVWGAYALVDGVFNLVLATRGTRAVRSWGWLVFEGVVSIFAGVFTFARPGITVLALLAVIAVWAMLTGIAELAAAIHVRRQIRGEWLLGLSGALSLLFGVLLFSFPDIGTLALLWVIGVYAIAFGAALIGLGFRLNQWRQTGARGVPTGGLPTPA